jgi:hypothetical protein
MSIEAMKQCLEALEINLVFLRNVKPFKGQEDLASDCVAMTEETITSLHQAIAEAEKQEPVAWMDEYGRLLKYVDPVCPTDTPLYTHPQPKREWVGLTDDEIEESRILWLTPKHGSVTSADVKAFVQILEAKLKEKNT